MSKTKNIVKTTTKSSKKVYSIDEYDFKELNDFLFKMANEIESIYFENSCATDIIISENALCEIDERVDICEDHKDFHLFQTKEDLETAKKLVQIWNNIDEEAEEIIYNCVNLHVIPTQPCYVN